MAYLSCRLSFALLWLLPTRTMVVVAVARGANNNNNNKNPNNAAQSYIVDYTGMARGANAAAAAATAREGGAAAATTVAGYYYDDDVCMDVTSDCFERSINQGCIADFTNMELDCPRTCLLCDNRIGDKVYTIYNQEPQHVPVGNKELKETLSLMQETDLYMYETVYKEQEFAAVATTCQNIHASCSFWAALGECQNNAPYMNTHCAAACQACSKLVLEERCPVTPELLATSVWKNNPGDLNRMFERIVSDPQWQAYNLQILSRPNPDDYSADNHVLPGPWILTMDDFLSAEECETLIVLGAKQGYERSEDLSDQMNADGTFDGVVSQDRTSTNTWCEEACVEHPLTQGILQRMEQLMDIPVANFEDLQLLRYEVGQKYGVHHDFIDSHVDRQPGPRILTLFFYLNNVEEGGGTNFPELDLTIYPKRGRALLWPSVLDQDPNKIDYRTDHQALPVEKGIKYGANAWVHLRDFQAAHELNCH